MSLVVADGSPGKRAFRPFPVLRCGSLSFRLTELQGLLVCFGRGTGREPPALWLVLALWIAASGAQSFRFRPLYPFLPLGLCALGSHLRTVGSLEIMRIYSCVSSGEFNSLSLNFRSLTGFCGQCEVRGQKHYLWVQKNTQAFTFASSYPCAVCVVFVI